jgi:hypothetical protein
VSAAAANFAGLGLLALVVGAWEIGLLWRVGAWLVSPAETLTVDEGLKIGTAAPQVACYSVAGDEMHLDFEVRTSFVVFGTYGCVPCEQLLRAASWHPATRSIRRVYIADERVGDLDPAILDEWEVFTFFDETATREMWRAPVSPYFHLVDPRGRISAKGVASRPDHLDRLLTLAPPTLARQKFPLGVTP